ncbi:hypothetical protein I3842_11G191400 [Carya illinoinensis]|uniref:Protein DA1-like domain-containing protein n=1 Tax=Carya illinoinensis TaxID=32201 RepID=A0A922DSZ8_CARIL|nr:hypothetical protein I3842_11G191400 [Carya illinoinensis]
MFRPERRFPFDLNVPKHNCPLPACNVCDHQVLSFLRKDEFWGYFYCYRHLTDGTPRCWSCHRLKQKHQQLIDVGDGRKLCPDCYATAVVDVMKLKPLVEELHKFYKKLGLSVERDIPILLVDKDEINRVNAIVINTIVQMKMKRQHLSFRKHPVTSIVVLFGMPSVCMGRTLAHEMMHVWLESQLKDHGQHLSLEKRVREGICEVMSYTWLESAITDDQHSSYKSKEQTRFVRKLIAYSKMKMETSVKKDSGDGFRAAKQAVDKFGLKHTLNHIARKKRLPG